MHEIRHSANILQWISRTNSYLLINNSLIQNGKIHMQTDTDSRFGLWIMNLFA